MPKAPPNQSTWDLPDAWEEGNGGWLELFGFHGKRQINTCAEFGQKEGDIGNGFLMAEFTYGIFLLFTPFLDLHLRVPYLYATLSLILTLALPFRSCPF